MDEKQFTTKELRDLGFNLTQDGGTSYYQLLLQPESPIESDFLCSDDIINGGAETLGVKLNNAGEYLSLDEIKIYI